MCQLEMARLDRQKAYLNELLVRLFYVDHLVLEHLLQLGNTNGILAVATGCRDGGFQGGLEPVDFADELLDLVLGGRLALFARLQGVDDLLDVLSRLVGDLLEARLEVLRG